MDANAHPELRRSRLSSRALPTKPGKDFGFRGRSLVTTRNTDLNDLIAFAYGLQATQIVDADRTLAWYRLFTTSRPSRTRKGSLACEQVQVMVQKLLSGSLQADISSRQEGAFCLCDQCCRRRTEDDQKHSRGE